MNSEVNRRLEIIEAGFRELKADKERKQREWEITELGITIAREYWWDALSMEELETVLLHMKKANQIMCKLMGMHLELVTISRGG